MEWIYDYTDIAALHKLLGLAVKCALPEPDQRHLLWHRAVVDGEVPPFEDYTTSCKSFPKKKHPVDLAKCYVSTLFKI